MPEFSFPATERLKSKKQIQYLFTEGKSIKRFPLRLLYRFDPKDPEPRPLKMAVAVSAKRMPLAVDRNRIKRWIREAYRLQRSALLDSLIESGRTVHLVFVYMDNKETDYEHVKVLVHKLLEKVMNDLTEPAG